MVESPPYGAILRHLEPFGPLGPGAVTMVMIATVTASFITSSGRSAWFIGALLIFIYAIFALTLYVVPPPGQGTG
jgi:Ca2+:H+ antiporter